MKPLPRRPMVGLALVFLAGTWAGLHWEAPAPHAFWLALALLAVAAGSLLLGRPAASVRAVRPAFFSGMATCCLYACLGVIGWINAGQRTCHDAPTLISYATPETQVEVIGVVADQPEQIHPEAKGCCWRLPLRVERIRLASRSAWHDVADTMLVRLNAPPGSHGPAYSERWRLSGTLKQRDSTSQGGFYQRRLNFLTADMRQASRLAHGPGEWMMQTCQGARAAVLRLITHGIEDSREAVDILESLLLGYRSQMSRELYRVYAATGTLHIFAISGSHVVVLGAIIIFALNVCGLSRLYWVLFLAPLLILYTVMTGLQPSAVRACIMGMVYWLAPLLRRKADIYSSLSASAVLIVAAVPNDLMDVGFILSYVAVLGIVLLFPVVVRPFRRVFQPDPLQIQPDPLPRRVLRSVWMGFSNIMATTLAAWLVSVPLTAYYFHMFSPIALLGNLVAVPVSSLVIVTGSLSLVAGSCVSALGVVFNHANLALVSLLNATMRALVSLPGAWMQVDPPSWWYFPVFYATLMAWRIWFSVDTGLGRDYKDGPPRRE